MAIAYVKGGGNHAEGAAASYAFASNVTAGSLIVVGVQRAQDGALDALEVGDLSTSGTATLGAWALDVSDSWENYSATYDKYSGLWSAIVTGTGSLTVTLGDATSGTFIVAGEFSGSWDAARLEDTSAGHAATATPTTGDGISAGAALFFGVLGITPSTTGRTITEDAAFTLIYEQSGQNLSGGSGIYQLASSGTTDAAQWTINSSHACTQCLAVYKEVAAAVTITQEGYRWRIDDGDEANATWAANQDTGITSPANAVRRLRILVDTAGDANATQFQLECKEANDANYQAIA